MTITVTNVNNDPEAQAGADQTVDENTPVSLSGSGSSDPDSDFLTYTWTQTEGTVLLRAERSGNGDGRVCHIHFTASDLEGRTSGVVTVSVPKKKRETALDGDELYDSTQKHLRTGTRRGGLTVHPAAFPLDSLSTKRIGLGLILATAAKCSDPHLRRRPPKPSPSDPGW